MVTDGYSQEFGPTYLRYPPSTRVRAGFIIPSNFPTLLKTLLIPIWVGLLMPFSLLAQETSSASIPPIIMLRAEESYAYLTHNDTARVFLRPLKWIPISPDNNIYLTLGGEYRARLEHFTNRDYTSKDETYYTQRIAFHAALKLGNHFRLFGELYHGSRTGGESFLDTDDLDLHQGFLEWKTGKTTGTQTTLRLGRQEMGFGDSRLVGIREGPNMRRTFDMGRLLIKKGGKSVNVVYGKEVDINFSAFDNTSNLFNSDGSEPSLWGVYVSGPFFGKGANQDFYYLGFQSNLARLNDVIGKETRHTVGFRSYGNIGKRFSYNSELILQFGEMGDSDILAFNLETDWTYALSLEGWKPTLGIRLDWSSGDSEAGDGTIQTFNPIFVNPAIYSLAGVNTPANLTSFHPNFEIDPSDRFSIYVDYALFYRTQAADGLYTPPRFLTREANGISERHIGDVLGFRISYDINRNINFNVRSSYFLVGSFIKASGESENTFYIAPTLDFKF